MAKIPLKSLKFEGLENEYILPFKDFVEDADYPGCFYRMVDGEKEWMNPPLMERNTVYRTIERFVNKPVYYGWFIQSISNATAGYHSIDIGMSGHSIISDQVILDNGNYRFFSGSGPLPYSWGEVNSYITPFFYKRIPEQGLYNVVGVKLDQGLGSAVFYHLVKLIKVY